MMFLILTVLLNTLLSLLFKAFPRFRIDAFQAIVINYWVCVGTGSLFIGHFPIARQSLQQPWLPYAIGMGAGFITLFNLIAYCTRTGGITTATVANKLSLVIPVLFAVMLYGDAMSPVKILGILLAFPAVYFSSRVPDPALRKQALLWPALLFLGSGLLDTLANFVSRRFFFSADGDPSGLPVFLVHAFAVAGTCGLALLLILLALKKARFSGRNVLAGVLLGVPNYFSMYFFLKLLNSGFLQSSAAIPVTNIATVLCAVLCAYLLFREPLSRLRILGLALSVTAILLLLLSDSHARTA